MLWQNWRHAHAKEGEQRMTNREAEEIINKYESKSILTAEEEFLLTEAFSYLIEETKDPNYMVRLGGYYYGRKDFDLALKYYEMADTYGSTWAAEGLGYIWYYGRTGEINYEKAFHYYSKAAKQGYSQSLMKVADMYRNGYYVEKDYDKYCKIIEELYERLKYKYAWGVRNDVLIRLARIRKEQGDTEEAIRLFLEARLYLTDKLVSDQFFGDLSVMSWLIKDLYEITEIDMSDLDLYDLYYLMRKPCKVAFLYKGDEYTVEAVEDEGGVSIRFGDKWFRSIEDFFLKAELDGEMLPVHYASLYAFRVV